MAILYSFLQELKEPERKNEFKIKSVNDYFNTTKASLKVTINI